MACFLTQHLGLFQPLLQSWNLQLATLTTTMKEQGKKMQTAAQAPCRPAVYLQGNAEDTRLDTKSFDLVTIMYAFHEAPKDGRQRILHEARRVLRPGGTLAIVDISDEYTPTESMLAGEPYVLEYQQNIHKQLQTLKGFVTPTYKTLIPGHVGIWLLKKKDPSTATM
jgi:ubiquinone/menaquinone biosynthesis C-methylase UbiE